MSFDNLPQTQSKPWHVGMQSVKRGTSCGLVAPEPAG